MAIFKHKMASEIFQMNLVQLMNSQQNYKIRNTEFVDEHLWLKKRLYFIQKIVKKSHKCCSTLATKYSKCFSISISLYSKNFVLNTSHSASNFFCHFSRYRLKNHEDISSQIAEFMPKISLEGCLPFWLLFKMAEKSVHEVSFRTFEYLLLHSTR